MWSLLVLMLAHIAAAFVHLLYYRDRIMRLLLPG
jgi:cytochrome b561